MIELEITNYQARALYAVLNITGKHCEHIDAPSIESQAAVEAGMPEEDMEDAIKAVWRMIAVHEDVDTHLLT